MIQIANRKIGSEYPPFIIAEAGINHKGMIDRAIEMVRVAKFAGADCIKFQTHIAEAEMLPNHPKYKLIESCQLTEKHEIVLRDFCNECEIIFLSTAYCKEAADRLESMGVPAYKIGSGECNNTPLVEYIAKKGKPVILSTGMNDWHDICVTANILDNANIQHLNLHCTSIYPTPYNQVNLRRLFDVNSKLYGPYGISDHSVGIYTSLGAVALGAVAVEKHFDIGGDGPDAEVSLRQDELRELVVGSKAIWEALQGNSDDTGEDAVKEWAFHSVVTIKNIKDGEWLCDSNIGVKRAGKGGIPAKDYDNVVGKFARHDLKVDTQLRWADLGTMCTT